jgi:hypothetical protein
MAKTIEKTIIVAPCMQPAIICVLHNLSHYTSRV